MLMGIIDAVVFMFAEMAPYIVLGLFFVGLLNLFVNKELIARQIGKKSFMSNLKAALFGVPLPLCSCGVIPGAVYMSKSGASKGATISFLISTPQTGIDSIIATYGMMGPVFAVFRPIAALIMGILGGTFINSIDKDEPEKKKFINIEQFQKISKPNLSTRIKSTSRYAFVEFLDDISAQFVFGVIIAGLIAYFIPDDFFAGSGIQSGILGMLIMIAIGIPMYICATASIPIALSLMMKGFSPGVAFVFLAAGPATNAASFAIISKTLGKKIAFYYVGSIAILAIAMGYILDWFFSVIGTSSITHVHEHTHGEFSIPYEMTILISIIFAVMLGFSFYRKYFSRFFRNERNSKMESLTGQTVVGIEGMTCNHCVANVKIAIEKVPGVESVDVRLDENNAYIQGTFDLGKIKAAVDEIGYKIV
ncbi:MAG: permease [Candidatus Kapabacteria bacterium]|nr:permease [Candidatus Kapabacteria bacterium]